jgi:hypothetical protein
MVAWHHLSNLIAICKLPSAQSDVGFGVKNGSRGLAGGCPLCAGERTSFGYPATTEKGQKATSVHSPDRHLAT